MVPYSPVGADVVPEEGEAGAGGDDNEAELALGDDDADGHHDDDHDDDGHDGDRPPSPSQQHQQGGPSEVGPGPVRGPSTAARAGKALLSGLDRGSAAMFALLREDENHESLVQDYLLDSMDYDKDEDYVNEDAMEKRGALHQHLTLLLQFLMTVAVAFVTAMIMYVVSHSVEAMHHFKVHSVFAALEEGEGAKAYFTYLGISLLYCVSAAAMVSILAPRARGGGVPYVMAYLNGTNVMDYFSARIVGVKSLALICTIAGGLTQGMEGPFVFIGGGVAAILNTAMDVVFPFFPRLFSTYAKIIRGIREERIFMSGGMAAGLAVAFDAPIAGVLFALEGSTAFLSAPVVLRIFGCAMFASFFNNLGHTNFSKYIHNHNLLRATNSGTPSEYAWNVLEIFPFLLIGLVGGVLGALCTKINMYFSRWRHHHLQGASNRDVGKQILEIVIFSVLTATSFFVLPYIFGCRPKHELCDIEVPALPTRCVQAQCAEGHYSEIATIVYSTANQIAALLFDRSLTWEADFHTAPLFLYCLFYTLLVAALYGAYVPGGLFVPSIVAGGLFGRIIGIATKVVFPDSIFINPGVYSLLGAAAMLGGFTRLALPVVIMLVELTGDATYLLPMMLCSVVGKFTSDALEPPLYPQHMALEKIPSLTDKLNPEVAKLQAKDIMLPASKCQTLCTIARMSTIKDVLAKSNRIVFPLVTPSGFFAGLILRRNVIFCVSHSPTYQTAAEAAGAVLGRSHAEELRNAASGSRVMGDWRSDKYDVAHTITRSKGSSAVEDSFINFTPYMDSGCLTARPATPAKRLAALFRRVGLSHLCITDKNNVFQGLITRRVLIYPPSALAAAAAAAVAHAQHAHGHAPSPSPTAGAGGASSNTQHQQQHAAQVRRRNVAAQAAASHGQVTEEGEEEEHKADVAV